MQPGGEEEGSSGQSLPPRGEAVWPASQQTPQGCAHGSRPPVGAGSPTAAASGALFRVAGV